jgi:hypothetical protein
MMMTKKKLKKCHCCGELKSLEEFTLTKSKWSPRCDGCFSWNRKNPKTKKQSVISSTTFGDYNFVFESDLKFWH